MQCTFQNPFRSIKVSPKLQKCPNTKQSKLNISNNSKITKNTKCTLLAAYIRTYIYPRPYMRIYTYVRIRTSLEPYKKSQFLPILNLSKTPIKPHLLYSKLYNYTTSITMFNHYPRTDWMLTLVKPPIYIQVYVLDSEAQPLSICDISANSNNNYSEQGLLNIYIWRKQSFPLLKEKYHTGFKLKFDNRCRFCKIPFPTFGQQHPSKEMHNTYPILKMI